MKIAYYPGCSGLGTSAEYDKSTRAVCAALGVELVELQDWSCCGSTPAHATDARLSAALCARNLHIAEKAMAGGEVERLATPCPSCQANLKTARHHMAEGTFRGQVNALLDGPVPDMDENGNEPLPDTFSVLQVLLENVGLDGIRAMVKKPLTGVKVAPYYGCLLTRPAGIMHFDREENPVSMDQVLEALGAEVVPYPLKTECCGAAMGIPKREMTARLSHRLIQTAKDFEADVMAVACPLCHMNLDLRQDQAAKYGWTVFDMPVLYFTQLMGIAFGMSAEELGLGKLCADPAPMLRKILPVAAQGAEEVKA